METIWPEIFIVESVAIVIGNLLTIVVLSNASSLKKRGNWLIINLAVADLLIGALSEPLYIATLKGYLQLFAVYTPVDILLGMASVFGLTALALDRLFAISRPFQHRTISDRAYVVSIVVIWVTASGIAIASIIASTNRFVVFFYIALPMLTLSQALMILSYVTIWIKVTSKRPRINRPKNTKLATQSGSELTQVTRTTSQNQEQQTGSISDQSVSEKDDACLLFDNETSSFRENPGSTNDESRSERDPWVFYDSETGSMRYYLGSTVENAASVHNLSESELNRNDITTSQKVSTAKMNPSTQARIPSATNSLNLQQEQTLVRQCDGEKSQKGSLKKESRLIKNCTGLIKEWKTSQSRKISKLKRKSIRLESMDRDNRLALTLFIATALSLLAWLPFEVMNIVMSLCVPCRVQLYNIHVLSFTKFLHYANSFVNPLIYTFRIQEFRRAINAIFPFPLKRKRHAENTSLEMSLASSWRKKTWEALERGTSEGVQ